MKLSIITATHQRPNKFKTHCLPSLLAQSNQDFEWIIINDGACTKTKKIVQTYQDKLSIAYVETTHQGLINARNIGLDLASSPLISFLDDDNSLNHNFVAEIIAFFDANPNLKMCSPIRKQRRDIYQNNQRIKIGKEFFKPALDASNIDFVQNNQKAWFDSNGFVHRKQDTIRFNPNTLIMSDYEYLLQCFSFWGLESLGILPKELILYIQTNEGIIGKSNFHEWLKEFEYLQKNSTNYAIFNTISTEPWLSQQIEELRDKAIKNQALPGFNQKK